MGLRKFKKKLADIFHGGAGPTRMDRMVASTMPTASRPGESPMPTGSYGVSPDVEQGIWATALRRGGELAPTGGALANAVNQRIGERSQDLLEQFNSRGQGVASGAYADALARAAGRETTEAELNNQGLRGGYTMGLFNPRLGAEFGANESGMDQQWTSYRDALKRAQERQEGKKNRRNRTFNAAIGIGGALLGGAAGGGGGEETPEIANSFTDAREY